MDAKENDLQMEEDDLKDQGGRGPSKSKLAQSDELELQTIGFEDVNDLDDLLEESDTMDPEENARKAKALAEQKKAEEEKKQKE